MSEKLNRVYRKLDPEKIKPHLMVYGAVSASCAHCGALDLKITMPRCPECRNDFKYIAFRSVKSHLPRMSKLLDERSDLLMIDYDDYTRNLSASKAEGFFNQ